MSGDFAAPGADSRIVRAQRITAPSELEPRFLLMRLSRRLGLALLISFLIHSLFTAGLWYSESTFSSRTPSPVPPSAQLQFVELSEPKSEPDRQKKLEGQVVDQGPQLNDEVSDDARFLSRHNQKVLRETRAARTGRFRNAPGASAVAETERHDPNPGADSKLSPPADVARSPDENTSKDAAKDTMDNVLTEPGSGGIALNPRNPLMPSFKPQFDLSRFRDAQQRQPASGAAAAATDDHLKDVPVGVETLLSTREFLYFSYYNRIKEQLRAHWEPRIRDRMRRVMAQGRSVASAGDRVTQVVILLDSGGKLVRVQVIGPSGIRDLDEAAVEAFRAAAPFPNPPNGISDSDGYIRIRWDFVLEA